MKDVSKIVIALLIVAAIIYGIVQLNQPPKVDSSLQVQLDLIEMANK